MLKQNCFVYLSYLFENNLKVAFRNDSIRNHIKSWKRMLKENLEIGCLKVSRVVVRCF